MPTIVLRIKSNIATPSAAAPGGVILRLVKAAISETLTAFASAAAAGAAIPSAAAFKKISHNYKICSSISSMCQNTSV